MSEEMGTLTTRGVSSFKMFMAYKNAFMIGDEAMYYTFLRCKELGYEPPSTSFISLLISSSIFAPAPLLSSCIILILSPTVHLHKSMQRMVIL